MGITPEESILGDAIQMSDGAGALNVTLRTYVRDERDICCTCRAVGGQNCSKTFEKMRSRLILTVHINRVLDDWVSQKAFFSFSFLFFFLDVYELVHGQNIMSRRSSCGLVSSL